MAFRVGVALCLVCFSASFLQGAYADLFSCPSVYGSGGFSCPRSWESSDEYYCCDSGTSYQSCCTYEDYYGYYYTLSTGAIVGIAIGCLVFVGVVIASIVACCVCCVKAAATPPPRPVTMHTVNVPQQPGVVTVQHPAPPTYYQPPTQQPTAYPGQQQQFQPAQPPPVPGQQNRAFEKDPYPYSN